MHKTLSNIFTLILHLCKYLVSVNFCQLHYRRTRCTFDLSMNCMSLSLTVLKINVETFDDCLYLLDGHLDSLTKLIINVLQISYTSRTIDNGVSITVNY